MMLWLRWSWRDLRARWVQVATIALILALGSGAYAGLASTGAWRQESADASYAALDMYDVRAELSPGSLVPQGTLTALLEGVDLGVAVTAAEERLIVPVQLDASTPFEMILVRGAIIGVPLADAGPAVNGFHVRQGRSLTAADTDAVLIEANFAEFYELPPSGTVLLGGGRSLDYVGQALTPEFFVVQPETGGLFSQSNYGALFSSLETAQNVTGLSGMVNDLVLTIDEPERREDVAARLEALLAERMPEIGTTVMVTEDDGAHRMIYEDIKTDQQFYNVFATLILAGAVFAAFNLTTRMVEATGHEIGVAMALGVPGRRIAIRPLLVGAEIALLGVAFGVGVGLVIADLMRGVLADLSPLPIWETRFQPGVFTLAAAFGFFAPFLASAFPVWRAVRVAPVDAIRTGHLAARGGGLAPLIRRLPLPGDTFGQMPFRNLLRAPRRAVLTVLGVAAAVTVLAGLLGMIDSFLETVDRGEAEVTAGSPDRITVDFDRVQPLEAPDLEAVRSTGSVATTDFGLHLNGALSNGDVELDAVLVLTDFDSAVWVPTVTSGVAGPGGVLISEGAAHDLDVEPGDVITLRHPLRTGTDSFDYVEVAMPVLGTHPHPFRFMTYLDLTEADRMGLAGLANSADLTPAAGADVQDVQLDLFHLATVASVQRADATAESIREFIGEFVGILQIAASIVLLLALLIAFNSASINLDERSREHATMFAYGVRVRTVLRVEIVESFVLGVVATAIGIAGGYAVLHWVIRVLMPQVMPDVAILALISPGTLLVVVVLGVGAVALAPLLTLRRLRNMDVASTLRVME